MRRAVLVALTLALALPAGATDHSGSASGLWRASDSPHRVLGSVLVPGGQELTVEAGSVVVFDASSRLVVDGTLTAPGTAAAPIAFASMGAGAPGEWKGIILAGPGPHRIENAEISAATTAVSVNPGVTLLMSDSIVTGTLGVGVAFSNDAFGTLLRCSFADNGSGVAMRDSSPTLTSCRFTGNGRAAWVSGSSYPELSELTASGNAEGDGVILDARLPVTGYGSWTDGGIPWIVTDGSTLTIDTFADVQAEAGATVKMGLTSRIVVDGALTSSGTPSSPCRFTSLRDDEVGGDTNGDGFATTPGKGDWDAIEVSATGVVRLQSAVLRHADDAVRALGGDTTLWDCDIRDAASRGAVFGLGATGYVFGTSFADCDTGLLVTQAGSVIAGLPGGGAGSAGGNSFTCNASFDAQNLDDATFELTGSWFGPYGPDPSRLSGPIDTGSDIVSVPERMQLRRELMVSRPLPAAITFRWETVSSCSTYRLAMSTSPEGPFGTISTSASATINVPAWSLPQEPLLYFELDAEEGTTGGGSTPP